MGAGDVDVRKAWWWAVVLRKQDVGSLESRCCNVMRRFQRGGGRVPAEEALEEALGAESQAPRQRGRDLLQANSRRAPAGQGRCRDFSALWVVDHRGLRGSSYCGGHCYCLGQYGSRCSVPVAIQRPLTVAGLAREKLLAGVQWALTAFPSGLPPCPVARYR